MTADERRDAIVAAATEEFAIGGLVGASTEAIARQVGVSQPYVFQLFGTKKDMFLAVVRSCFAWSRSRSRPPPATGSPATSSATRG
jgi:AcrR family transcriptional regulator